MNKTKKNGFLKAACMMLSATMLAACVVAGTMAKYTSNTSMSASADVAKWSIQVDGDEIQELSPKNLSFTIYDTNPSGEKVTDEEVTTGKIAPGTWGYAEIDIKNAGEVDADITAAFDKGGNLPKGMKVIPLSSVPASAAAVTGEAESVTARLQPEGTANMVIAFVWDYDTTDPEGQNDDDDLKFGTAESAELSLGTLKITATQVD